MSTNSNSDEPKVNYTPSVNSWFKFRILYDQVTSANDNDENLDIKELHAKLNKHAGQSAKDYEKHKGYMFCQVFSKKQFKAGEVLDSVIVCNDQIEQETGYGIKVAKSKYKTLRKILNSSAAEKRHAGTGAKMKDSIMGKKMAYKHICAREMPKSGCTQITQITYPIGDVNDASGQNVLKKSSAALFANVKVDGKEMILVAGYKIWDVTRDRLPPPSSSSLQELCVTDSR